MSPRNPLRSAALLAGAAVAISPTIAQAHQPAVPAGRAILSPQGIGSVRFGEPSASAVSALSRLTDTKLTTHPTAIGCGVDQTATARGVTLFLGSGKLIGYQVSSGAGLSTTRGLAVGDSISRARAIYGSAFTTTLAQGGDWHVGRGADKLSGFLHGTPPITGTATIQTIDAGVVGCAAAQP